MKPWNGSESRPGPSKGSWLKALAQRVRDWLDRLHEEGENRAVSPSTQHSSTKRVTYFDDAVPPSNSRKEGEVAPWNALKQPGPPEAWLKLVRERAPGLLRSVEEGGVPWSSAREISVEGENPRPETTSVTDSLPYSEVPAWPAKEPIKSAGSPAETATVLKTYLLQVLRRLRPTTIIQKKKDRVGQRIGKLQLELARLAALVPPEPAAGPPRHVQATQHAATESGLEALSKSHTGGPPASWRERVLQKVGEVFANVSMNRSLSKGPPDHKKENAQLAAREKPSRHFAKGANRVSSRSTSRSVSFESQSVDGRPKPGVSKSQEGSLQSTLGIWPNPSKWLPLPTGTTPLRMQSQESSKVGTRKAGIRNVELPASQRVVLDSFDSTRWPESEQIESWPELPEDSRANDTGWRESLRISDHLRAIDLEQKGGR